MTDDLEELPEEIVQGYIDGLEYHMQQGMLSRRQLEHITTTARRKLNEILSEDSNKEYLNLEQGSKAYTKILETGITAQEALEYVAEYYGKDKEWVEEVKNNNYLHAKQVFKYHENHEVQKAMKKDGTLRPKALKHSNTPNKQLRELYSQRKLHTTLNNLKEGHLDLESQVSDLQAKTIITESNIDLVMSTLDLEQLSLKDKASKLKQSGFTQSKISTYLGVSLPTIKRWWKSL